MNIEFFTAGTPKGAGSKVAAVAHKRDPASGQQVPVRDPETGRLRTYVKDDTGEAGRNWRADVRAAAEVAMRDEALTSSAVMLSAVFIMRRPKSHFSTSGALKSRAPLWHTSRPDIDKLSRAVLDALTGIVWTDDSLVVCKIATKRYADPTEREGAQITVTTYVPSEAARAPQLELIHGSGT